MKRTLLTRESIAACGRIALVISLLLAVGLLALAGGRGLRPAAPGNPPATTSLAAPPARVAPMIQAAGGYTLTVQPLTADLNGVAVHVTIQGFPSTLPGNTFPYLGWYDDPEHHAPRLRTDDGRELPLLTSMYSGWRTTGSKGDLQNTLLFDTAPLVPAAPPLRLQLVMGAGIYYTLGQRSEAASGPLTFTFEMPFDPAARVTELHQTVGDDKGALTLERFIVTRGAARAVLHFSRPGADDPFDDQVNFLAPNAVLLRAGEWASFQPEAVALEARGRVPSGWTYTFLAPLFDQPGAWTLTVKNIYAGEPTGGVIVGSISGPGGPTGSPYVVDPQGRVITGRWVFHFTLPAAGDPPQVNTPVFIPLAPTLPAPPGTQLPPAVPSQEP